LAGSAIAGSLLLVMFLPASLVAVSLLKLLSGSGLAASAAQSWLVVSAGQAARFAGLALIVLLLTRYPDRRRLDEMARLDGATLLQAWRYVHLPRTWPALLGAFLLLIMFSFTELSATMVLLPAGLPNFAQRLLNQMHYARDQQVIATCLVLVVSFVVLAGTAVLLLRVGRVRRPFAVVTLLALLLTGGCGGTRDEPQAQVVGAFGKTGPGPGEFLYPRAIDLRADGTVLVADKTGRIQRLGPDGRCLAVVRMPRIEAGKPTGISVHPDGRLFVADTHYHRVAIFSSDGEPLDEFGRYGQDDGCFIYPTDVAFAPDSRLFVSEYGGNDRISVFSADGQFLTAFGEPGAGPGQFARPSAVCVDASRGRLYVADACNHRIGVYDLEGQLASYVGSAGRGPGQLRYPYDLALLDDGTLVVCEYGNNRIQLFRPDGQSLALYGQAGRQKGDLAYPWGVAVDARRQAFIVDAGNNRIQVWQL
jgi:DNA-binding beta-propeller fold protein YncE